MQKLLISIFFILFFVSNIYSQSDTSFSIYDNMYLSNNVDKQQKIIADLNKQILNYQNNVNKTQTTLTNINSKINIYSKIYASSLTSYFVLKNTISSPFMFFLSSNSFNNMYNRFSFIKLLISYVHKLHAYIHILKTDDKTNIKLLKVYKSTLNAYLISLQEEKTSLDSNFLIMLKQTNILQQKSNQIRISINKSYTDFEVIGKSIRKISANVDAQSEEVDDFVINCMPIDNPVVISSYGVHSHPSLKNVKIRNDGIDLYSKTDTLVKLVADGIVVKILNVPNFGNSIIVKHKEFYSVYSSLNQIYIKEKEVLVYGKILGSISKSSSKYSFACLNFQIWKLSKKMNPNIFLKL